MMMIFGREFTSKIIYKLTTQFGTRIKLMAIMKCSALDYLTISIRVFASKVMKVAIPSLFHHLTSWDN